MVLRQFNIYFFNVDVFKDIFTLVSLFHYSFLAIVRLAINTFLEHLELEKLPLSIDAPNFSDKFNKWIFSMDRPNRTIPPLEGQVGNSDNENRAGHPTRGNWGNGSRYSWNWEGPVPRLNARENGNYTPELYTQFYALKYEVTKLADHADHLAVVIERYRADLHAWENNKTDANLLTVRSSINTLEICVGSANQQWERKENLHNAAYRSLSERQRWYFGRHDARFLHNVNIAKEDLQAYSSQERN